MSGDRARRVRRGVAAGAAVALAVGLLGGCAVRDSIVGLHPAPSETVGTAPLTVDAATTIVSRVLGEVAKARTLPGAAGKEARQAVMNGPALAVAEAAAGLGAKAPTADDPLSNVAAPTILALSRGSAWPRAIFATTLDPHTNVQGLHVLTSAAAVEPFVLSASVPMFQGAVLPGLGDPAEGVAFLAPDDGAGLVTSPQAALTGYANALSYPKPKVDPLVATSDQYATALRASATALTKGLGALATYTQSHVVVPEQTMAFRLADGGAVVLGRMNRVDKVVPTAQAREITIPEPYAKLVGRSKATRAMQIVSVIPVALVVPPKGKVTAIGAGEQLASGKAE